MISAALWQTLLDLAAGFALLAAALLLGLAAYWVLDDYRHPAERNLTELFEEDEDWCVDDDWTGFDRAGPEGRERVDETRRAA